jgi:hypothetical protein
MEVRMRRALVPLLSLALLAACSKTVESTVKVDKAAVAKATAFDYADWTKVTTTYVNADGNVDYARLQKERQPLDSFVALLAEVGPKTRPDLFKTRQDQLAYYINAYNAFTMFNVIGRYPIKSVNPDTAGQISFFATTKFKMDGDEVNLLDLENKIVRPTFKDPRVHFALNCASGGCPHLPNEPFLPETVEAQLDREKNEFLHEARNVTIENGKLVVSNIFEWYKDDFAPDPVSWIKAQAPDLNIPATITSYEIRPYDWQLNDQSR